MDKKNNKQKIPIFMVSTGRTGSTFLADALNDHHKVLIVLDLIEPLGPNHYFDRNKVYSGKEFFDLMSRPSIKPRLRYWKVRPTKERLFYPSDENLVSLLLCYTIPFLTKNPMGLFYELKKEVSEFPDATMADHTLNFFDLLRRRFSKDIWVEKTGGSLPQIDKIVDTWPDAKYIYSYRDGREVAISMQKHPIFRMYCQLLKKPDLDEWDFDYLPPIQDFGKMWQDWTLKADKALSKTPDGMKLDLPYEELEKNAEEVLISLLKYILDNDSASQKDIKWARKWAKMVKMAPIRFTQLSSYEQEKLEKACTKGLKILKYPVNF